MTAEKVTVFSPIMTSVSEDPQYSSASPLVNISPTTDQAKEKALKNKMETERHEQLVNFMTSFKLSVESMQENIKDTNKKLDAKMEEMNTEIRGIKTKMNEDGDQTKLAQRRMEERLDKLEIKMKKLYRKQTKRQNGHRKRRK